MLKDDHTAAILAPFLAAIEIGGGELQSSPQRSKRPAASKSTPYLTTGARPMVCFPGFSSPSGAVRPLAGVVNRPTVP